MVRFALVIFNFRKNQLFEGTRLMNDGRSGHTRRSVGRRRQGPNPRRRHGRVRTLDELTARRRASRPRAVLNAELVDSIEAAAAGFTSDTTSRRSHQHHHLRLAEQRRREA